MGPVQWSLQPAQIALGVTPAATNLLDLDYGYGATASVNNGNITKQTISVPTVGQTPGFTAVQNYTYDSLNRLKSAVENITPTGGSQSMSWQQTFEFDRYGNRNFEEANTTFTGFDKLCNSNTELCSDLRKILNPSINQSNNRLSTSDDYVFDSSGNTTEDAQGRIFVYDAENKQIEVLDSQQNVIGEYWYDGDGRRIKKHVPSTGEVTVFVYSAGGQLVAEYSTIVQTQLPKVSYTTADHLGSPRILTDENGATISRRDFHPFGEEILTTHRHPDLGYTPDEVRQKFTSYERDEETELDFAQARYYNKNQGRFASADPISIKRDRLYDPQIVNLYAYARNNPLAYVDVDGKDPKFKVIRRDKTYGVSGKTVTDALRNAVEEGKRVNTVSKTPGQTRLVGDKFNVISLETTSDKDWNGSFTKNATTGEWTFTSKVTNVEVTAEVEVTTPTWTNKGDAKKSDQEEWDRRNGNLKDHEEEHAVSIEDAGKGFAKSVDGLAFSGKGKTPQEALDNATKNLNQQVNQMQDKAIEKINKRAKELDSDGKNLF